MKLRKVLIVLFVAAVAFLIVSYFNNKKEGFQDNLYGQGKTSCKEQCTEQHPQAARMDLDADNSIADEVMGECMKQCEQQKATCPSCA